MVDTRPYDKKVPGSSPDSPIAKSTENTWGITLVSWYSGRHSALWLEGPGFES